MHNARNMLIRLATQSVYLVLLTYLTSLIPVDIGDLKGHVNASNQHDSALVCHILRDDIIKSALELRLAN